MRESAATTLLDEPTCILPQLGKGIPPPGLPQHPPLLQHTPPLAQHEPQEPVEAQHAPAAFVL